MDKKKLFNFVLFEIESQLKIIAKETKVLEDKMFGLKYHIENILFSEDNKEND